MLDSSEHARRGQWINKLREMSVIAVRRTRVPFPVKIKKQFYAFYDSILVAFGLKQELAESVYGQSPNYRYPASMQDWVEASWKVRAKNSQREFLKGRFQDKIQ